MLKIRYLLIISLVNIFILSSFGFSGNYLSSPSLVESRFPFDFGTDNTPHNRIVPQDWHVAPGEIVYHQKADPSRKTLETRYAVSVVVLNERGEVLFSKRNPKRGGIWSLPSTSLKQEDDPDLLGIARESIKDSLGVEIMHVRAIGKRMGYRRDRDGHEWQLLMHDVFATAYTGEPRLTGNIDKKTDMPKYTDLVFSDPREFLTGSGGMFQLAGSGDCTKCLGTILFSGYEQYENAFAQSNRERARTQEPNKPAKDHASRAL